jgi:hypothetical protein
MWNAPDDSGFFHLHGMLGFILHEGIFVPFFGYKSCDAHVSAFPSHQTEELDGRGWIANFCNFLGYN